MLSLCSALSLAQQPALPFAAVPPPSFFFPAAPNGNKPPMRVHRYSRRVEASRRMARLLNPFASLLAAHPPTAQQHANALLDTLSAHTSARHRKAGRHSGVAYADDATPPDDPQDPTTDPQDPVGTDPDYPDDPLDPWWGYGSPGDPWSDPTSPWNDPSAPWNNPFGPGYDPGPIGGPPRGHGPRFPPTMPAYRDPGATDPSSIAICPAPGNPWRFKPGSDPGFPGSIGTGGGGTGGGGTGGGGTGGGGGTASSFSFYVEWPYNVADVYLLADVQRGPIAGVSTIYVVPDDPSDLYAGNYVIDIYNPAGKLARHLTSFGNAGDAFTQMWSTAEHSECNGTYRVVVTKTLTGGGSIQHESTFDVQNLVVTSTSVGGAGGATFGGTTDGGTAGGDTSGVLRYDPNSADPLTINVKVDAAYKAELVLAWATIYSADHKTVMQTFVQTLNHACGSAGTANFSLDARQLIDAPSDLPKGIYFYCVHACSTSLCNFITANGVDYDDDKTVAPVQWIADLKMKPTGDDGTTATYDVLYKVTGSEPPQDAHVDYYDDALQLQHSWPVHPDTDPIDPDTGDRKISLQVPSGLPGMVAFQSRTGPSLSNKSYQQRSALPRGTSDENCTIAFAHSQMTSTANAFVREMQTMGYKKHPNVHQGGLYDWTYINPVIEPMRTVMEDHFLKPNAGFTNYHNPKRLKTLLISGHGYNPQALIVSGNTNFATHDDGRRWLITQAEWNSMPPVPQADPNDLTPRYKEETCLVLETIKPTPLPFSNLDLVYLAGCSIDAKRNDEGASDAGSLLERFRLGGASFCVVVGWDKLDCQANDRFLSEFFLPSLEGKGTPDGKPMGVREAFIQARLGMNAKYNGATWLRPGSLNFVAHSITKDDAAAAKIITLIK